jgi:hypothetical protein
MNRISTPKWKKYKLFIKCLQRRRQKKRSKNKKKNKMNHKRLKRLTVLDLIKMLELRVRIFQEGRSKELQLQG